jgi:hypothetical protein
LGQHYCVCVTAGAVSYQEAVILTLGIKEHLVVLQSDVDDQVVLLAVTPPVQHHGNASIAQLRQLCGSLDNEVTAGDLYVEFTSSER